MQNPACVQRQRWPASRRPVNFNLLQPAGLLLGASEFIMARIHANGEKTLPVNLGFASVVMARKSAERK